MTTKAAILLAAGCGRRLSSVIDESPKGLIELGGRSLVERILKLLQERGFKNVTIVTGFKRHLFQPLIERYGAREVINQDFDRTGTLRSLSLGLAGLRGVDVLVVESDLFFDERGLDDLLRAPSANVVLASGFTGAGDEVWLSTKGGRVNGLSKVASDLPSKDAEFVGVTRLSVAFASDLYEQGQRPESEGLAYDTDGLHGRCSAFDLRQCLVTDLLWGEIDDASHLIRVRDWVHPAYVAALRSLGASSSDRDASGVEVL